MKKGLIVIGLVLVVYFGLGKIGTSKALIPDAAIRLRVLANSNSTYDQEVKKKVSAELQTKMASLLKDTKGVEEARKVIENNLPQISEKVKQVLQRENYPLSYQVDFGYHHFPEKEFKGITYQEGDYESVLVTIGEGLGDNWWCVLFPPLCLLEAEESSEVEYKFFVQEMVEKYF